MSKGNNMKKIIMAILLIATGVFADSILDQINKAYKNGNYYKAAQLAKKACNNGNIEGCGKLGYLYEKGKGVKQDYFKAAKFYQKACNGGIAKDCFRLAI